VHGRHLVEELGADDLHPGLEQLGANNHREETAQQKHRKAEPQVHGPDIFVVGGKQPAADTFGGTVVIVAVSVVAMRSGIMYR
jgi:hypothetical protein